MKIAILGVLSKPITAQSAGGTEVFCALLAEGLAKKGHEVVLFATPESHLEGVRQINVSPKTRSSIRQQFMEKQGRDLLPNEGWALDASLWSRLVLSLAECTETFDIIHDNTSSYITGVTSDKFATPMVTTTHMPPANEYMQIPQLVINPTNYFVAISQYQQKMSSAPYMVYNGIDIAPYVFDEEGGNDLMWIGRVSPNSAKGLKEALIVTSETGKHLHYAANISNQPYFEKEIVPHLGAHANDVGIVIGDKKQAFLAKARAGLFPIMWEEPFGFVFVECMAVGTPVIAFARGAVPEIIVDGVTGFIVNPSDDDIRGNFIIKKTGLEGIKEAIERMYALSLPDYQQMRKASRQRVEDLFTVDKMIDGYENVYKKILSENLTRVSY